jgi:hypothetical protein
MTHTHYLYLIKFSDGRYYIGSRKCDCRPEEDTEYMGSPVTFKELWNDPNLSKTKYIIREVDSYEETARIENKLIEAAWEKDGLDIVLNRNSAPRIHPEACSRGGKKSGKLTGKMNGEKSAREFTIVSPIGKVFQEKNLRKFCREHNLHRANVIRVLKGTRSHSAGWTKLV